MPTYVDVPSRTGTGSAQFIIAVRTKYFLGWTFVFEGFPIDTSWNSSLSRVATFLVRSCCYTAHLHPIERSASAPWLELLVLYPWAAMQLYSRFVLIPARETCPIKRFRSRLFPSTYPSPSRFLYNLALFTNRRR